MKVYTITLTVDEGYLEAIGNLACEVYDDEFYRVESLVETDTNDLSYSMSEMAGLTHETQVSIFGWCGCEDNEGNKNPYEDCPTK